MASDAIDDRASWIPRSPPHDGVERWYCPECEKITPIEFNPEWIADGKPFRWKNKEYDWFVRCATCAHDHYQRSRYTCPKCGWDAYPNEFPFDHYFLKRDKLGRPVIHVVRDFWKEDGDGHVRDDEVVNKIAKKHVIYPIISNYHEESDTSGHSIEWKETHCCPLHGEFSFENGS